MFTHAIMNKCIGDMKIECCLKTIHKYNYNSRNPDM